MVVASQAIRKLLLFIIKKIPTFPLKALQEEKIKYILFVRKGLFVILIFPSENHYALRELSVD